MFQWFASKQTRLAATKIEQRAFSARLWHMVKYFMLLPFMMAAAVTAWFYLQHHRMLPVHKVEVLDPGLHVDAKQLEQLVNPTVKHGFLWFNLETMQAQLETLPWVAHADIQRQWPDILVIQLSEYKPLAVWNKTELITANGTVFTPSVNSIPAQLISLNGPKEDAKFIAQQYKMMQQSLDKQHLKIIELDVSDRLSWLVKLDNGMVVNLGQKQPLRRLNEFAAIYPEVFADKASSVQYVDMRYDHGMAVKWQPVTSKAAG